MSKLVYDGIGTRIYETGVSGGVLFPLSALGAYDKGVAWSGLNGLTETPSGAEPSPYYADNIKYLNLTSLEELGGTIEAYTYPDEFGLCNGEVELTKGIAIAQQTRKTFGLCYKTQIGNDIDGDDHGYKLHLIYGCLVKPSEKAYKTVSDSPDPMIMSWEFSTTPAAVTGHKPTASITIDSTKVDAAKLALLELQLYGRDSSTDPVVEEIVSNLPSPDAIAAIFAVG